MSDSGRQLAAGSARQRELKILRVVESRFNPDPVTRLQVATAGVRDVDVGSELNEYARRRTR